MKIDRLIALIMILLEREVVSARELAERLEVSRRTIYRDIDTLTFAGARISKLQVSQDVFVPRDFSPLPMDGTEWMSQEWVEVTMRIHRSVVDKVIERFGEAK